MEDKKSLFQFLPQKPPWYLWLAVGAIIIGSILISIGNINGEQGPVAVAPMENITGERSSGTADTELLRTAREMEILLKEILEKVSGAGEVQVRVSLVASPLKEFAINSRISRHSVEERDQGGSTRMTTDVNEDAQLVMARGNQMQGLETPVVVRETRPEVQGVIVVAQGGGNPVVRARITQAVETLWGLAPHQVQVLPMEH